MFFSGLSGIPGFTTLVVFVLPGPAGFLPEVFLDDALVAVAVVVLDARMALCCLFVRGV
uniref:Uncharacterized protein n=1 Tax=Arundo donax TaxID=35708 RepID=A0A0A9GMC9_ARUDO